MLLAAKRVSRWSTRTLAGCGEGGKCKNLCVDYFSAIEQGRFGALLTPQGKITTDFLITEAPSGHGGGFLLDCPRVLAQGLADKLGFYRLRAKVVVENLSDSLAVLAAWDGDPTLKPDLAFADPRSESLGWRILVPAELGQKAADLIGAEMVDSAAYDAHRIASGVPRGGLDCGARSAAGPRPQPARAPRSVSDPTRGWPQPPPSRAREACRDKACRPDAGSRSRRLWEHQQANL